MPCSDIHGSPVRVYRVRYSSLPAQLPADPEEVLVVAAVHDEGAEQVPRRERPREHPEEAVAPWRFVGEA